MIQKTNKLNTDINTPSNKNSDGVSFKVYFLWYIVFSLNVIICYFIVFLMVIPEII